MTFTHPKTSSRHLLPGPIVLLAQGLLFDWPAPLVEHHRLRSDGSR